MQRRKDIEIKIWAEINGFMEISDGVGDKSLLMPSELREYNVEGLNNLNSDIGFCSVFYATNSYIVGFHFLSTDKRKLLEHRDTVVAVVIRRGFKLVHLFAALSLLRKKYETVLANQDKSKGIRELGFDILQELPSWEEELNSQLEYDRMQPIINLPGTVKAKGYVSCKTSMEISSYLEYPLRTDLKGAQLMLYLPKDMVENSKHKTVLNSFQPVSLELIYHPKFVVYFPAYKEEPIAVISSLDEELNFTFEKQYCTPIELKGRYIDHISDWKIQKTSDNAGYNIGLQFEEQEFRYNVYVLLNNLNRQRVNAKNIESWLVPSIGRIETDGNGCWLILRGAENNSVTQVTFSSNREDYLILNFSFSHNIINLIVEEVFYFDVPGLKREIERKYNFSPKVYYSQNNQQWKPLEMKTPFKGNKQEYKVKILGSEEYDAATFSMTKDFNSIELKRKPALKLTILFEGEIRKWLETDEKRGILLQTRLDSKEARSKKKLLMDSLRLRFFVNLSNSELELPPFKFAEFYFEAPGFKTEYKMLSANTNKLILDMQLVWWKKIWKTKLTYALIGIFVGFGLGVIFHYFFVDAPKREQPITPISAIDSYNNSVDSDDTIEASNHREDSNSEGSNLPQQQMESVPSQEQDSVANPKKSMDSEAPNRPSSHSPSVNQPSESPSTGKTSYELFALLRKLKGIDYTHGDLSKAKEMAKNEGQFKKHEQLFRDCEFALHVATVGKMRSASFVKRQLRKHPTLHPEQIRAIMKIIEDEDVFNCDTKSYMTIKRMLDAYKYSKK